MSTRWSNTQTFPNLASPANSDILPIGTGTAPNVTQRTVTLSTLKAFLEGFVGPDSAVNDRIAVFNGTTGNIIKDGGNTIAGVIKAAGVGTVSTVDPASSNDSSQGYRTGSLWYNTTTDTLWVCTSAAAPSAAEWETIAATGGSSPDTTVSSGPWWPELRAGSGTPDETYTQQWGRYQRVGDVVTLWFDVTLSNRGTTYGNAGIHAMPFNVKDDASNARYVGSVTWYDTALNLVHLVPWTNRGLLNHMALDGLFSAGMSLVPLSETDIGNTTRIAGSITYECVP